MAGKPGKPRRDTLLAQEEAAREAGRADEEYQKTLAELESLGIRCLDPVAGLAIFTVYQSGYLAEYVFDLFDSQPLRFPAEHELCRGQGRAILAGGKFSPEISDGQLARVRPAELH